MLVERIFGVRAGRIRGRGEDVVALADDNDIRCVATTLERVSYGLAQSEPINSPAPSV
jgi:hypothetical protein